MPHEARQVSVIVTFLDEERFLEEAIASVYGQTYPHWELLLVDDGSTDASTAIARGHAARDPDRVRYLEHPGHRNRGISAARNLGIAEARGDLVAFLDADDVWLPCRLERAVALLDTHRSAAMVYGRTLYWHSWKPAPEHADWIQSHGFRANRVIAPPELLMKFLLNDAALPCTGSLTVRREAALACGGFIESFPGLYEDQAFLARFCLRYHVFVADEHWDNYRQRDDGVCASAERRGEAAAARAAYLDWLTRHLEREGMRGTAVWDALQYALSADPGDRNHWHGRLVRRAMRTSARLRLALRRLSGANLRGRRALEGDP